MSKFIDRTGQKFGRLTLIERVENNKFNQVQWKCRCDCGKEVIVKAYSLTTGQTKSCGCLKKEQNYINIAKVKHNMTNTRLYNIWRGMKSRCLNPNNKRHKFYFDKGITVCDEWKNDFMNFYNWAINNGYRDNLTIDRINNNGNYEPKNCRWATITEQNNNQSNNIRIKYNESEYTLSELSKIYNIKRATLYDRIKRRWTIDEALNRKVAKRNRVKSVSFNV